MKGHRAGMEMVQVMFQRPHENLTAVTLTTVAWVDASWDLNKGDVVSFKGEVERWHVAQVYETRIEAANLGKKWGLNLPKSQRTER